MNTLHPKFKAGRWAPILLVFSFTFATNAVAQVCTVPPSPGLVSWYPGDGDATDLAGSNNGTPQGGVMFATGEVTSGNGEAFDFDGNDDHVTVPNAFSTFGTGAIDFWFNPSLFPDDGAATAIFTASDSGDSLSLFRVGIVTQGTDTFLEILNVESGVFSIQGFGDDPLTIDTWHHGVVQQTGSGYEMYVDGVKQTISLLSSRGSVSNTDWISYISDIDFTAIGARKISGVLADFFEGLIEEVEIFNRPLTGPATDCTTNPNNEICNIFLAGSAGKCKFPSVAIDIKPGSDPNCFNIDGHGVIPVAILGAADFDVFNIDFDTIRFDGLTVRVRGQKGPLCSIEDSNGDAFLDLVCHFEDDPSNWTGGGGPATVTGLLMDTTPFEGRDFICIIDP